MRLNLKKHHDRGNDMAGKQACGLHCIKIQNIGVKVGSNVILHDVNIHIHCGELTVIIGRNGAGKTTLLKALLGEIKHSGGIIFTDKKNGKMGGLKIGYVPQSLNLDRSSPLSVYDLCASYISDVPVFLYKSKKIREKIIEQLKMFNAENLIDKSVGTLSGGELQRVLLAVATIHAPHLLVLDEPASGIDLAGMKLFYEIIDKLKTELDIAVILVSHDLDFTAEYADKIILLDKTVEAEGTPEEVYSSEPFFRYFGKGTAKCN